MAGLKILPIRMGLFFFFFPAKVEKYNSKIQTGIEHCTKKHLKHRKKSQKERERERNRENKGHSFHEKSLKKVATSYSVVKTK